MGWEGQEIKWEGRQEIKQEGRRGSFPHLQHLAMPPKAMGKWRE